jgi:hypothetical protein
MRILLTIVLAISLGSCGRGNALLGHWVATSQRCYIPELTFTDKTATGSFGTTAVSYDFEGSTAIVKVDSSPQTIMYTIVSDSVIRLKDVPECAYKKT